jgi:hypothetical protein
MCGIFNNNLIKNDPINIDVDVPEIGISHTFSNVFKMFIGRQFKKIICDLFRYFKENIGGGSGSDVKMKQYPHEWYTTVL